MKAKNKKDAIDAENQNRQSFDVIIIGGGAAGLSAALWCDDLGLDALLLESKPECGGQLLEVYNPIKNHLGIEAEDGRELRDLFVKQMEKRKFTLLVESELTKVDLKAKAVFLKNGKAFSARALIIATGVRRRKLNVEGEEEFKNKGMIQSGKRDKDSVKGKTVCIVGGGDAAMENALILSETANRVYLVHRRREFSARREFTEQALANKKVVIFTETTVEKILGEEKITAVELRNLKNGELTTLPADGGVLLRIGVEPNTELFRESLKLDKNGYIEISGTGETSAENVFAAGDVANPLAPTVSSAVGSGATAVKVIFDRLNR